MIERYLHAIYCDDVRFEIGNKQSYIGVYGGDLLIPECPTKLPKICIVVFVSFPLHQPIKPFTIIISKDNEVLIEAPIEENSIEQPEFSLEKDQDEINSSDNMQFRGIFNLFPFVVEKECNLKVRVKIDTEEMIGPSLKIRVSQSQLTNA